MKEAVQTSHAHKGVGPYSQGVKANGFVFISGQLALDPVSGDLVSGGIEEQTKQVLKNLSAILSASGSDWGKVVKTMVFLKDIKNFAQMNEIYAGILKDIPPVRTTIEAGRLPKDALIEIDVIALA